jgi:cytoskeletal protein CcmA (bactofilin family)
MKKFAALTLCFTCLTVIPASRAVDFKQSKVTQVVNDVQIISAADQVKKAATVNDIFAMPDILRTGAASRAELVAEDDTITRVGANTIFSFDPANRTIDLQQGSLLFHSPHGKGGGTIHTGSATASVLGSTLIVTTTPNGGFKVIALEDNAEIHLRNGLKQKLKPGEMTFILPGGSELAPILVFRLDELIRNSLLVKGFNQPLTSLPLILNQVNKQTKLITSGRATDTGLLAGNNATPNQVEVLDANTIQSDVNAASLVKAALGADATINQPSLTDATIPTPPGHVFPNSSFMLADNKYFGSRLFSGFVARNIFINTPAAKLNSLTVDLSPYAGNADSKLEFDFVAANNLNIAGSVTFAGLPSSDSLFLIAGKQISIAPDIAVQANVADFELAAPGALELNGITLQNNAGDLGLTSGSDFTVKNGQFIHASGHLNIEGDSAGGTSGVLSGVSASAVLPSGNPAGGAFVPGGDAIFSGDAGVTISKANFIDNPAAVYVTSSEGSVNLSSLTLQSDASDIITSFGGSVSLSDGSAITSGSEVLMAAATDVTVDGATINAGAVSMQSGSGSVTVKNTSIHTGYLTINSGDGILLDASGQTVTATVAGATANLTAKNIINLNNLDFSSFPVWNAAANTIVLVNDIFSGTSIYNFGTATGSVVINAPNPLGLSIVNSTLGGTPISSISQINLSSGPGSTPGMYSYALVGK